MTEFQSLLADDESELVLDCLDSGIQAILKVPFAEDEPNELSEDKYLIHTTDGKLLWITCSTDLEEQGDDSSPAIFVVQNDEQQQFLPSTDDNLLTVSSIEYLPDYDQDLDDDDDVDTDEILKVEDRVKVFDAILAPSENKVKIKTRVGHCKKKDDDGNYICDLCGASFAKEVQYYGHLHQHTGEFLWDCRLCPETARFPSQAQLRKHEKKYHVNLRPHSCTQCGATFDRPSQLDYHKRRIHEGERSHVCQICNKAFFKRSDLKTHVNTHLSVHGCICDTCGRRFSHVSNLTRHMRTHSGIKPYPCSICGRRFNQLNALNEHKASHMNQMPVVCCGKEFKTQLLLKKHLKTFHQTSLLNHNGGVRRRFHCKVCGNSFPFLTLLRKHELTHNQIMCSGCKKELNNLEELKIHSCKKPESVLQLQSFIPGQDDDSLDDMYLDPNTDWIDTRSQIDKLDRLNVSQVDGLLDEEPLTCSEVDKLVRETCCQVESESLPIDSLITPLPPSPPSPNLLLTNESADSSDWLDAVGLNSDRVENVTGIPLPDETPKKAAEPFYLDDSEFVHFIVKDIDVLKMEREQKNLLGNFCIDGNNNNSSSSNISGDNGFCDNTENDISHDLIKNNHTDMANVEITNGVNSGTNSNINVTIGNDCEAVIAINDAHEIANSCSDIDKSEIDAILGSNVSAKEKTGESIVKDGDIRNEQSSMINDSNGCKKKVAVNRIDTSDNSNNKDDDKESDIIIKCKNGKQYKCKDCGKQFQKANNFRQHLGIHDIGRQLYCCKVCGRSFAWKSTLNKHSLVHTDNHNPPIFPCETCKKIYTSSSLLQAHVNRDHLKQRPHKCSVCPKSFFKKYDLKIHLRTHTNERPYICGACGRSFGHISHLIRHEKIHTGDRPYQCSSCPASFIQYSSLHAHQKHHMKKESKSSADASPDAVCYLAFVIGCTKEDNV